MQETQHYRQHAVHDGEVHLQPGGPCPGTNRSARRGEKENRSSTPPYVAKVRLLHSTINLRTV